MKTLTRFDVERRFGHFFVPEGTDPRGLSQTMGTLTFYLVLLLAVPSFLAALGQSALVAPLSEMLRILLSYLPNVAAAVVSVGLGWVVARILGRGPQSSGRGRPGPGGGTRWTRAGPRWGAPVSPGGDYRLLRGLDPLHHRGSRCPEDRGDSRPAINALETLLAWVPKGLGGAVLLILAWVISRLVGDLVTQLLRGVGFDGCRHGWAWWRFNRRGEGRPPSLRGR